METDIVQPVEVQYEGLDPKDAIINVNGQDLGGALKEVGYPPSIFKKLVIDGVTQSEELARYDYFRNAVVFRQGTYLAWAREAYGWIRKQAIQESSKDEKSLLKLISNSGFLRFLNPQTWPYLMMNKRYQQPTFFMGNPKRREQYFKAARERKLAESLPPEKQLERVERHLKRLTELALERSISSDLAHEYEHIRDAGRKALVKFGLMFSTFGAGFAVLGALNEKMLQNVTASPSEIGALIAFEIFGIGVGGMVAFAKGRALEEEPSYEAGCRNLSKFMDCFKLNRSVFEKEVLARVEQKEVQS